MRVFGLKVSFGLLPGALRCLAVRQLYLQLSDNLLNFASVAALSINQAAAG